MAKVGRKKGLYYNKIVDDVLSYVRLHPGCTAREIADRKKYSWVTVDRYLKMLLRRKLIKGYKRGKIIRWVKQEWDNMKAQKTKLWQECQGKMNE